MATTRPFTRDWGLRRLLTFRCKRGRWSVSFRFVPRSRQRDPIPPTIRDGLEEMLLGFHRGWSVKRARCS